MFFRFLAGIALVVLISLAGVALEKERLRIRRNVSRQHYRTEVLRESLAKLRLRVQKLGAPAKLMESLESGQLPVSRSDKPATSSAKRMPLLHWEPGASAPDRPSADD